MSPRIVNHFCGTHNLKLWPPHIDTTCVPHIGKQTHIDTFCGTRNLKLWPPHIDTTCVVDIGKQTHIDSFCGTYNLKLWPPHIETTCVSHIEKQSLYVATHPILVLYECYYMWPHIVPFSANYLPQKYPVLKSSTWKIQGKSTLLKPQLNLNST